MSFFCCQSHCDYCIAISLRTSRLSLKSLLSPFSFGWISSIEFQFFSQINGGMQPLNTRYSFFFFLIKTLFISKEIYFVIFFGNFSKIGLGKDDMYFWKQMGKAMLCTYTIFGLAWLYNEYSPLGWWTFKTRPKVKPTLLICILFVHAILTLLFVLFIYNSLRLLYNSH